MKLQARTKTSSPPGLNIAPAKDHYIKSGLTKEASEDEYFSLLGRAYLDIELAGYNISLLGNEATLTSGDVYIHLGMSI